MATVTRGYTWTSGETVTPAKMNDAALPTVVVADDEVTNDKLSLTANAGEIKKALNADNAPPIYACRAWVAFDGSKDTTGAESTANTNRLIISSGNVASVLRTGTGAYVVTFTTAMPSANYAIIGTAAASGGDGIIDVGYNSQTTSSVNIVTGSGYRAGFTLGVAFSTTTSIAVFA
jgi:aconitase B